MNRIVQKFSHLKKQSKTAFMPFVVAGDPDFNTSLEIVKSLTKKADLLEIGFPYSDPLADGPTIQRADQRSLIAGMNTQTAFAFIKDIREFSQIPITILVYTNMVYQFGINRFYSQAKLVGADGLLIPDLPLEEMRPYVSAAKSAKIAPIFLITQTTSNKRINQITRHAQGYLYLVSVLGVTGARNQLVPETLELIKRVKTNTNLPIAVGFGISRKEHTLAISKAGSDGFIIGSALIKIIEQNLNSKRLIFNKINAYVNTIVENETEK